MNGFDFLLILFLHVILAYLITLFIHVRTIYKLHEQDTVVKDTTQHGSTWL
jgi:hypothetical protein